MSRTILIVDDARINRQILRKILSGDYLVLEAENGQRALEILSVERERVSAVLLDIVMPVMDGYAFLKARRSDPVLAQIPVIVTTGDTFAQAERRAFDLGANDFVGKPYDADILTRRLDNLIRLRETSHMVNALRRDWLTGLWNRATFFEEAAREIAKHPEGYFVLYSMDIDNFKVVNDHLGTEEGDRVLIGLARMLDEDCERGGGLCGRIAADNFGVLYPKHLMSDSIMERRERESYMISGIDMPVTVSMGRYEVSDKTLTVRSMFDRANIARVTIKGRYDKHIAVYEESMRSRLIREQQIATEMRDALSDGQFEAWYQPQYNHATGALVGAEALVRWRHPEHGLEMPDEFIPVFERSGFVYELDKCVWEQVCVFLRGWLDAGMTRLPVSVNISRYDLFRDDIVETLVELTERYGLPRELLHLEITETAFARSTERVVDVTTSLIGYGFTVEIDDFGNGYSSLNALKDVPAQILKLDMRFLEGEGNQNRGGNILESIVRMSKWLGMSVIAEGVEKAAQADYLKTIGCSYVQGYLYGRPMPAAQYMELARAEQSEAYRAALETVEHLDNNTFWNPESMDTLMFNSYVGAACIFEYKNGRIELLRSTEKYAQMISGGSGLSVADTLRLDWSAHLDEENQRAMDDAILRSQRTKDDVTGEYLFRDLPGCPELTYIRGTLRVVAATDDRRLVYNLVENVTAQREAERKLRETAERLRVSAEEYRLAVEGSGRYVYRYNHSDNSVDLTDRVAPVFGLPAHLENVPECLCGNGLVAEESQDRYRAFYAAVKRGDRAGEMTICRRNSDGSWHWLSAVFNNIFDDDGRPISAIISFADVTEQREREVVFRRWQQSIEERAPEDYTLYRWNLSQDSMIDVVMGSLLDFEVRVGDKFNKCTLTYAAGHVLPEDKEAYIAFLNANDLLVGYYRGRRYHTHEFRELTASGGERWLRLTVELVEYSNSADVCAYMMYENIDEKKQSELLAKTLAETDPLTGVLNRAAFAARVENMRRAMLPDTQCALMILDVDGFKLLNDTFGHAAGDQALIDMAHSLRGALRAYDLLGRLGGDEFLIWVRDMSNDEDIENKAKQICSLLRKSYSVNVKLSVSIGIAVCPRDGEEFDEIYRKADEALYEVKGCGKDGYAFYSAAAAHEPRPVVVEDEPPPATPGRRLAAYRRRMLIVEDSRIDSELIESIFKDEFIVEKARDGASALLRMRHYQSAISIVLLDLIMPSMSGFEVLEEMRADEQLRELPVVVVSSSDDMESVLRAVRAGAVDYVFKPVSPEILRLRVRSAVSRAENERLRAQNSYLSLQRDDVVKYRLALESTGAVVVEHDWKNGSFTYDPNISKHIAGGFDNYRRLWLILLSDLVADSMDVRAMQSLVYDVANDRQRAQGSIIVALRTPSGEKHRFRMNVNKIFNEFRLADKLILTFYDLDSEF